MVNRPLATHRGKLKLLILFGVVLFGPFMGRSGWFWAIYCGLDFFVKMLDQGSWAMLEVTWVTFTILAPAEWELSKHKSCENWIEFSTCRTTLCGIGMNLSTSSIFTTAFAEWGPKVTTPSNNWCKNCLQLCGKFRAVFFKHTSPLHCNTKTKNSPCVRKTHPAFSSAGIRGVAMYLRCKQLRNNALGDVLLKQKIALVFGNSSYMGEKKAVKTFFCEIAPDTALSTRQCVGEEKKVH